jgi:hypothetical protein
MALFAALFRSAARTEQILATEREAAFVAAAQQFADSVNLLPPRPREGGERSGFRLSPE